MCVHVHNLLFVSLVGGLCNKRKSHPNFVTAHWVTSDIARRHSLRDSYRMRIMLEKKQFQEQDKFLEKRSANYRQQAEYDPQPIFVGLQIYIFEWLTQSRRIPFHDT